MKKCVYCNNLKPNSVFSLEHILPKAIGGVILPENPFTTRDVCARCNNISGFFIDAPFIKSWHINNYRASNFLKNVNFSKETIVPLIYMGVLKTIEFEGYICDSYLGANWDTIYHFHKPYNDDLDSPTIIGLPPHLKSSKPDEGFVFIFIRNDNLTWLPIVIKSLISNFKNSVLYLGNGPTPNIPNFKDIPTDLKFIHDYLISINGKTHENTVTIDLNSSNRFLIKLALGIGSIFLNDNFRESSNADLLRKGLWTKNIQERNKLPIRGSGFFAKDKMKNIDEILSWDGGHIIGVMESKNSVSLYTNFYNIGGNIIQITDNIEHWKDKVKQSVIYIIIPEMQKCVGPLLLEELIAHKTKTFLNSEILKLENDIKNIPSLPSRD